MDIYPEITIYSNADGGATVIERGEAGEGYEYDNNAAVYTLTAEQWDRFWAIDGIINEARGSSEDYQEFNEDRSIYVVNEWDQWAIGESEEVIEEMALLNDQDVDIDAQSNVVSQEQAGTDSKQENDDSAILTVDKSQV